MPKKRKQTARELRQELLARLVAEIPTAPIWERPWVARGLPRSAATGRPFTGWNVLAMACSMEERGFSQPIFMTYKQAEKLGGNVVKGAKCVRYTAFIPTAPEQRTGANGRLVRAPTRGYFKIVNGFNIEETTLDAQVLEHVAVPKLFDPSRKLDAAEELLRHFSSCFVETGDRAFYSHTTDSISMPARCQYREVERYYSTAFHELIHWTGARHRLERLDRSGDGRATEELTAELGAAFLCASVGLPYSTQHVAYLASWSNDALDAEAALSRAASQASKAYAHLQEVAALQSSEDAVAAGT